MGKRLNKLTRRGSDKPSPKNTGMRVRKRLFLLLCTSGHVATLQAQCPHLRYSQEQEISHVSFKMQKSLKLNKTAFSLPSPTAKCIHFKPNINTHRLKASRRCCRRAWSFPPAPQTSGPRHPTKAHSCPVTAPSPRSWPLLSPSRTNDQDQGQVKR